MKDATRRDLLTGLAALAVAPVAATPALGDDVEVDGGKGTVTNKGQLQIATLAPLAITGSFTQTPAGALGLDFADELSGTVRGAGDRRGREPRRRPWDRSDRPIRAGERRQFRHPYLRQPRRARLRRPCARRRGLLFKDRRCVDLRRGVRLKEDNLATSLDLLVTRGSAVFGPAGSASANARGRTKRANGNTSLGPIRPERIPVPTRSTAFTLSGKHRPRL